MLEQIEYRLAFTNQGGLFGMGVCWWHSALTRAAAYLALFDPTQARPTTNEARQIIQRLASLREIVVIPGYSNLYDFSQDFRRILVEELESWQWREVIGLETRGLKGKAENSSVDMQKQMELLYQQVEGQKRPTYVMLQRPGVAAHSWLVIDIQKHSAGYDLYIIDPNNHGTQIWRYKKGMAHFLYLESTASPFIPYLNDKEQQQLIQIEKTVSRFCEKS